MPTDTTADADRERQISARMLGLAARLRDRIEADERGKHQRRRRQQDRQRQRRRFGGGHRTTPARLQRGGERGMIEGEPGDDHHATEDERQEHERNDQAFVGFHAANVHEHGRPEERERDRQPDRSGLERSRHRRRSRGHGDVAQERNDEVGDHTDRHAQREPLRERGDEAEVGIERATRVHVAAAGARHGRGQHRIRQARQHGRQRREDECAQHVRTDAGYVALDHERDDVDARTNHRADTGGHQAEQPHLTSQSGFRRRGRGLELAGSSCRGASVSRGV